MARLVGRRAAILSYRLGTADGVSVTVCRDSPGFIAQRIVAMIVNIGCSIAQSRTAQPPDIVPISLRRGRSVATRILTPEERVTSRKARQ